MRQSHASSQGTREAGAHTTNLRKIVNSKQVGDAGEFEVAKQLCRIGVNATVTKAGSTGVDLFAELEGRSVTVQVKTRKTVAAGIHKHDMKPDGMSADFVVFVALNWCDAQGEELDNPPHPTCYVLPQDVAWRPGIWAAGRTGCTRSGRTSSSRRKCEN